MLLSGGRLSNFCHVASAALQERRDAYRMAGVSISKSDQEKQLPEIKQESPRLCAACKSVLENHPAERLQNSSGGHLWGAEISADGRAAPAARIRSCVEARDRRHT